MVKVGATTIFGLLTFAVQALALLQPVKVMPFGASIMTRCWRNNLEAKLKAAGVTNYDMVGSQKGSSDCTTQFPGTDSDNEGHPGSLATDFAAKGNLTGWLNDQPTVDVVLMLIGHNDIIIGKKTQDQIIKAYDTLIAEMRKKNPKMQIVWSDLTPVDPKRFDSSSSPNNSKNLAALSSKIKSYAPTKSTSSSPVRLVDTFSGYDPVADTVDGEHPNTSGNEKIASKFFSATKDAIQAATTVDEKAGIENNDVGTDFTNVVREFLEELR